MDFALTEEQERLRRTIIAFAQAELNEGAKERDRDQAFPHDLWLRCGTLKLQGLPVPEAYGGAGADPLTTAVALEALGYGCQDGGLMMAISAHLLACVIPVWKYGSDAQKDRYLPGLSDGTIIAANGMTEPDSGGSDAFSMAMTAEREDGGFRLNGTKTFVSNGPVADLAVIYARTNGEKNAGGGVTAFLVEKGTPGFRAGKKLDKMSLRSCSMSELVFEDVLVPAEAVLGGVGAGSTLFNESMEWERICLVATHVGKMQRMLEQAVQHARKRVSFGQKIGKFQAVSHRIADMKVRLEAARWLTYKAAWRLGKARDIGMDAAIAKLFVSEALVDSAMDTVRTFGGYGVLTDFEVERGLRDAVAGTLYSGTSDMQRNIIARWLGL